MMTDRERVLAILEGRNPDRIPWIPILQSWWLYRRNTGTLPEKYEGMRLGDVQRDLGMGSRALNGRIFTVKQRGVDTVIRRDGMDTITEYITPVGTLRLVIRRTPELDIAGIPARTVGGDLLTTPGTGIENPIKGPEGYDVLTYIIENTRYLPCYEEYLDYEEEVGDRGYPLVKTADTPFNRFLMLAGYDKGYLQLYDHTDKVERLLEIWTQKHREELWPVIADSPAKLIQHGVQHSSLTTPPPMFKKYITPYMQEMSEYLHKYDKVIAHHADNDTTQILGDLKEAGWDMQECFATEPLVTTTLKEARKVWGNEMIIWGGIPSILLVEDLVSDEEFETYMDELFATIAPGDAFILGVSDIIPGPASLARLVRVRELVEERGKYPIQA